MNSIWQDIRYSLRLTAKNPGFTAIAVITLALGIGANTAIFSVVNSVLLNPLPYENADRLVMVWSSSRHRAEPSTVSPANFLDWREQNTVFEELAALRGWTFTLTGDGAPEQISGVITTSSLFPLLGIKPLVGRGIEPQDERGDRVAVLSYGLWQTRFGADAEIVGKKLILNSEPFTIVGVMPKEFAYPEDVQIWASPKNLVPDFPLNPALDATTIRGHSYMQVIGRLKGEVSIQQARAEMDAISRQLEEQYPDSNTDSGVSLRPLTEQMFGNVRPALLILFISVGFVLLIACANVANLTLVRVASRQKEIAIRFALGAKRWRIIRQLLIQSLILSVSGGTVGVLIAVWGIEPLIAIGPGSIRNAQGIGINLTVLLFTLLLSLATGILSGLFPALRSSRPDLNESLKETGRASTGSTARRSHNLLVISEIALSLLLLIGAGLMLRSYIRLENIDPGFNPQNVIVAQVSLSKRVVSDPERLSIFVAQALEQVSSLPLIQDVGAISRLPMSGGFSTRGFTIEGRPLDELTSNYRVISPGYFSTMGIPLIKGRDFGGNDRRGATNAVIISESFARQHFPGEDPLGKRITIELTDKSKESGVSAEIIGIAGNVRHFGLAAEPVPEMYVSYFQQSFSSMTLVVRSSTDVSRVIESVKNELWALDKEASLSGVRTMEDLVSATISNRRFAMLMLTVFAAVALILAAVGIYGVISYTVSQRSREIGIRMALGASRKDILRLVTGQSFKLILSGVSTGIVAALMLTRFLSSLVFGVSVTDLLTFVVVSGVLIAVAIVSCLVPACRATKVDPGVALRYE